MSERTAFDARLIRAIEQDDYSPCGGDFYVLGHIRAFARVVGADPAPLIEQYDAAHGLRRAPHLEPGEGDPARIVTIAGNANGQTGPAGRARPSGITAADPMPVYEADSSAPTRLPFVHNVSAAGTA